MAGYTMRLRESCSFWTKCLKQAESVPTGGPELDALSSPLLAILLLQERADQAEQHSRILGYNYSFGG